MDVSLVIPVYNERDNVVLLCQQIREAMAPTGRAYEVVFVDDGSTDDTVARLKRLAEEDARIKLVAFRRNFGQTAAMSAGLAHAAGDVIVTMDGDLQNDPADIPMMLAKIDEGYDLVHGWRKNRQDAVVHRKLPSKIANWLISKVTGFPIHDLGCTLKAVRREIARELELYGELHRFIPILAHQRGARSVEVVTNHHARRFGNTKYGIDRTWRVILDLITVQYMLRYFDSPMKLFGSFGLTSFGVASFSGLATVGMKLAAGVDMTGNPLLLLTALATLMGMQFISLGLLGEVSARIYYGTGQRSSYAVRERVNFGDASAASSSQVEPTIRRAA